MNKQKGITLIALVITIIVLLILAGISIATLTGENGILKKASVAGEETKKAEYKEILELIGNGLRPEKVIENLSAEEFIKRYKQAIEEEINKGGNLEGATVVEKDTTTLRVITKEGYVYEITENKVEYIGKQGENPPPDLQESDIEFKLNPSEFTNADVAVEIITKTDIGTNILQYSIDGTSWQRYSSAITFRENGTIYARLINSLDEVGGVATKAIDKIDKEDPNQATVSFSATNIDTDTEMIATVTQSDNGVSGVNLAGSKWVYTQSDTPIGEDETKFTGGSFKENPEELKTKITPAGTYYLHILTVDNAGNKIETVKGPITVIKTPAKVGEIVTGENKEYTNNGTAIIPVGFAIKPGCDDIENGLVISDVANDVNDTGNQFVWIPVADETPYVRNKTFIDTSISATSYDFPNYLPEGITNEEYLVRKSKGFYISRYEAGKEGSGTLVSKKGAVVWMNINQANTVSKAKTLNVNRSVASALISGVQWDMTMAFIRSLPRVDGLGNSYDVTKTNNNRHRGAVEPSGNNEADKVCNIYDLEGNAYEYIAEKTSSHLTETAVVRGGRFSNYNPACSRGRIGPGYDAYSYSFRMVLYIVVSD